MVLVSRINKPFPFVAEYTTPLSIRSERQKYLIRSSDRVWSNGDIVISDTPPNIKHEVRHAFTIHSIQGETARHQLYIDTRKMWSSAVWYTAISRAQWLRQIKLVKHEANAVIGSTIKALIYKIWSPNTREGTLEKRFDSHNKKMDCMSRQVIQCGGAKIELVEELTVSSKDELLDREGWWINNTPGAVNAVVPLSTASVDDSVDIPPPEPPVPRTRIGMTTFDTGRVFEDDGSYAFIVAPPAQNFVFTA